MSRIVLAGAFCLVVSSVACGGGDSPPLSNPVAPSAPTAPTPPSPPSPAIVPSGDNWTLRFGGLTAVGVTGPYGKSAPLVALEGSFNTSAEALSAYLQPFGSCFVADSDRVLFTGTRSNTAVTMQSQELRGQVVRINATLSADGNAVEGTYSIAGGCASGAAGAIKGRRVDLTGVWTGTLGSVPTVFNVEMASTPDASAGYALSGTARFSNTLCFVDAVITRRGRGRVLFPDVVSATQRLELIVEVSEDLSTMHLNSVLVSGTCPELAFNNGTLVRQ